MLCFIYYPHLPPHPYTHNPTLQRSNCIPLNSETISCITPSFPSPNLGIADYTLVLDGAPAPDFTQSQLQISVLPDPGNFVMEAASLPVGVEPKIVRIVVSWQAYLFVININLGI